MTDPIDRRSRRTTKPPTDDEIQQIIGLHDMGNGATAIGNELGLTPNTVRKYLKLNGREATDANREQTKKAIDVRLTSLKERQMKFAESLMGDLERLRNQLFTEYTTSGITNSGFKEATLAQPNAQDQAHIMRSIGVGLQGIAKTVEQCADQTQATSSVLDSIAEGIAAQARAIESMADDKAYEDVAKRWVRETARDALSNPLDQSPIQPS